MGPLDGTNVNPGCEEQIEPQLVEQPLEATGGATGGMVMISKSNESPPKVDGDLGLTTDSSVLAHLPRDLIQESAGTKEPDDSESSCNTIRSVGTKRNDGTKKKDYSKKKEVKKNKPAQPFKYFRDNYKERNQSC